MDLIAHKVIDRFYIKRCNKCQTFGHYEKDCTNETCCGYCKKHHLSINCEDVELEDYENYNCINCEKAGKNASGHSSYWNKCPTYLELQQKLKKSIPFYNPKN